MTVPSRTLKFPVFDADNHMYETREAFTKFLPPQYKDVIRYIEIEGRTKIAVRGMISEYIPNPTFDVVAAPGAQEEFYRHGNPEGKSYREIIGKPIRSIPAYREPAPRLELLDEFGIDYTLMFPTLASLLEETMRDDPALIHIVVHALNEWMHETWTFNYADRIFSTPVISLPFVDKAIEELEWVLERGAKVILIRPAPVPGYPQSRSFGLPEFDPFWELVAKADILVGMHSSNSGYQRYINEWQGRSAEFLPFKPNAFAAMASSNRSVEDAASALICHGVLSRFPTLKIALIENGSSWVRPYLKQLESTYHKMPQEFMENPVDVFKRNIYVHPFHEDNVRALSDAVGVDHVLFGSDFPHPEGIADPITYVDDLAGFTPEDVEKVMGGNLMRLMHIAG
jgi:predicted TIM-barrel fold metal-dependent hydrolase